MYETANSLWKHEFLLKDIKNGGEYLSVLQGLIASGKLQLFHASNEILHAAYLLASESKDKHTVYDTVFVTLAIELALELATLDQRQAELYAKSLHSRSKTNRI